MVGMVGSRNPIWDKDQERKWDFGEDRDHTHKFQVCTFWLHLIAHFPSATSLYFHFWNHYTVRKFVKFLDMKNKVQKTLTFNLMNLVHFFKVNMVNLPNFKIFFFSSVRGLFWIIFGHYGSFWVIYGHIVSFWDILGLLFLLIFCLSKTG